MSLKIEASFSHRYLSTEVEFEFESPAELDAFQRFILKMLDVRSFSDEELGALCPFPSKILGLALKSLLDKELKLIDFVEERYRLNQRGKLYLTDGKISKVYSYRKRVYLDPVSKAIIHRPLDKSHGMPLDESSVKPFDFTLPESLIGFRFIDQIVQLLPYPKDEEVKLVRATICSEIFEKQIPLKYILVENEGCLIEKIINGRNDFTTHFDYLLSETYSGHIPKVLGDAVKSRSDLLLTYLNSLGLNKVFKQEDILSPEDPVEILGVIYNKDHPRKLLEFMGKAKKSLLIASGWVGRSVISPNKPFVKELLNCLDRGVDVSLYFVGPHETCPQEQLDVMSYLESIKRTYPNSLHLLYQRKEWHCKLILVDDDVTASGTYNWLSNSGMDSGEHTQIIRSKKLNQTYWNDYRNPAFAYQEGEFAARTQQSRLSPDKWQDVISAKKPVEGIIQGFIGHGFVVEVEGFKGYVRLGDFSFDFVEDGHSYIGEIHTFHVINIDTERNQLNLSRKSYLRPLREEEINKLEQSIRTQSFMDGEISSVSPNGLNILLGNGLRGYLSQSHARPGRDYKVGDKVGVRVTRVNRDGDKVNIVLTMNRVVSRYGAG